MAGLFRGAVALVVMVVLAGCGVTSDKVAESTTTRSTSTSTTTRPTTTSTTTTEPLPPPTNPDGSLTTDDPELKALLLSPSEIGPDLTAHTATTEGFAATICEGHRWSVLPIKQASNNLATSDGKGFVTEGIAEFANTDDAARFLHDLPSLNDACKQDHTNGAVGASFEPVGRLGDEAIVAIPDPGAPAQQVVVARTGDRIVLLSSFGSRPNLSNAVIAEAVDRASS